MILNKKSPLLYKLQGRACIRGTTLIITNCDIFISINAASRLNVLLFPKSYSGTATWEAEAGELLEPRRQRLRGTASQPVSGVFPPTTPLYKTLDSYYFPSSYLNPYFDPGHLALNLIPIYYNKNYNFSILSAYFDFNFLI